MGEYAKRRDNGEHVKIGTMLVENDDTRVALSL
jgi:hypothetical protein